MCKEKETCDCQICQFRRRAEELQVRLFEQFSSQIWEWSGEEPDESTWLAMEEFAKRQTKLHENLRDAQILDKSRKVEVLMGWAIMCFQAILMLTEDKNDFHKNVSFVLNRIHPMFRSEVETREVSFNG